LSKIKVNEIVNRNGSSITIGDANTSTVAINSGTTLTGFSSTGIDDNATSTALTLDSSANLQFNSGYGSVATAYGCRAWVNFNGTGTVAIRDSGNISSITDINTGTFQVNFTTNMPDANYCTTLGARPDGGGTNGRSIIFGTPYSTSAVRIGFINAADTGYLDPDIYCVAVFR
jgi:hypothetical protein